MRMLAAAIVLLLGVALIVVHQRYNAAITRALEEESRPVPIPIGPINSPDAPSLRFSVRNVTPDEQLELGIYASALRASAGENATLARAERPRGRGPDAAVTVATSSPSEEMGEPWAVLECRPDEDPDATFYVTLAAASTPGVRVPITSSEAVIAVARRSNGARLVELMAKVLDLPAPRERSPRTELKGLRATVSVLGENLPPGDGTGPFRVDGVSHDEAGDAPASGATESAQGTWTATRWFLEEDGLEAELWFNFDPHAGRGEIVRKNVDDAEDLLLAMATCLRDGPRPPRTPADDPALTTAGPRIRDIRPLVTSGGSSYYFTPNGWIVLLGQDTVGSGVQLVDPRNPDDRIDLMKPEGVAVSVICGDQDARVFVVQETLVTSEPNAPWWQSPHRIWRIDRTTGERQRVEGPWGERGSVAGPLALSPDQRYLAVVHRQFTPDGQRIRQLYFHDLTTGQSNKASFESSGEVVAWSGGGDTGRPLRAAVVAGGGWRFSQDMQRLSYLVDPATGSAEPTEDLPQRDPTLSPDGRHRVVLHPREDVEIVNVETDERRRFTFHEDDRRFARDGTVTWADNRYLLFQGKRQATIDTHTMKMCYLLPPGDRRQFNFSRDFKWAAAGDERGLLLGRVETGSADPTASAATIHTPPPARAER